MSRVPGTFIQNAFLKMQYYWEFGFEIAAPNAVPRFVLHFLNFLPAQIMGLGTLPPPGYNTAVARKKKMPFGKHKGEFVGNLIVWLSEAADGGRRGLEF